VAGCYECGDEPSGFCATELVKAQERYTFNRSDSLMERRCVWIRTGQLLSSANAS
jgi:hypothetical protein